MAEKLTLSFHGAAGTVTGSKHLVTVNGTRILLDAGLFQGLKELRLRNWESPGFDPASIDHVLLSHTHIDHVGYLPRLVKLGLRAPVYMTPAAFELAELMLLDSAKIQEEDARFANKRGFSRHRPAKPLYTAADARRALKLRREHRYAEWLELGGGLRARFLSSGHLLGAAFIELRVPSAGERELSIVYSGDLGRFATPLHVDPEPLPPCDVLILESTYGNRRHDETPIVDQVGKLLRDTFADRGTVLVPAFAVGRSQQVTLVLRRLMRQGLLPEVPIHLDSPMAINATRIYSHFLDPRNLDPDVFEDGRIQLFPNQVHFHTSVAESKKLNALKGPRVIVSSSGMLTAGRVLHHLARLAPDPRNLVMLAGYQAPGTRGRSLAEGADKIKVHGQHVRAFCRVATVHGLSGHADQEELLRWVESSPSPPSLVYLVHGEPEAASALAVELERRVGCQVHVAALDEEVDLSAALARAPRRGEEPAAARPPLVPAAEARAVAMPADSERLARSPAYVRADQDLDFLQRDELRPTRLQIEYLKPHLTLQDHGVTATIVVFGGTRIVEPEEAGRRLEDARRALAEKPGDPDLERRLAVAERVAAKSPYYGVARELGRRIAESGGGPDDVRVLVMTGGGPGIMEAANRGAHDVGAPSVGLNILLPHEQFPNPYVTPELCFQFRYFALRKMHFLMRARALVAFPGGYGTFDELFETLCLIQTRKIDPLPVVLVGEEFWRQAVNVDFLADEGVIDPRDKDLFRFAETAEEAWQAIVDWYRDAGRELFE